ncbi:MAG TPA: hypothetical protein VEG66_09360 [Thermoplasmata archaeon]|jgi:hypothetical protein|nr:hypothetical protein [Thermoplasmata archaeon]
MPLVLDPTKIPVEVLRTLRKSLRDDLAETAELVQRPAGKVLDPVGLETAGELLRSALARLDGPAPRTAVALGIDVNLAYATLLAVIDLVKAHTDLPRVPQRRPSSPA